MRSTAMVLAALVTGSALAQDLPSLTPVGAQREGNADGSIPEWTGGLSRDASRHDARLLDPYPEDQPLFTITSGNYRQYAASLSAGHRALFARHAGYQLPVYPTRRSVSFPDEVYAATAANRGHVSLKGADAVEGAQAGIPFPEPRSGAEVLWNHRLRYRGDSTEWRYQRAATVAGARNVSRSLERILFGYGNLHPESAGSGMHSYNLLHIKPAPPYPDVTAVWHDSINPLQSPRKIWSGSAGLGGKSMRNPPLGFDEVGLFTERIRYFDMVDMFCGSFERYVFKLFGKREIYVPYNSYRLARDSIEAVGPQHLSARNARYELHRVWLVEAALRPGEKHSIARRMFYVDEDSWSILLVDNYDGAKRLTRFQEGHLLPLYPIQAVDYAPITTYDLPGERYFVDRLLSDSPPPRLNAGLSRSDFMPGAAKQSYTLP